MKRMLKDSVLVHFNPNLDVIVAILTVYCIYLELFCLTRCSNGSEKLIAYFRMDTSRTELLTARQRGSLNRLGSKEVSIKHGISHYSHISNPLISSLGGHPVHFRASSWLLDKESNINERSVLDRRPITCCNQNRIKKDLDMLADTM